ncbi:uncharacterized protein LOC132189096 [Corylus avellana]|uniref:uncharacterized protein LOC132189096 n=1 Tax=Corylus avellana TaxID=13451 RepID=UPI00286BB796|nr:uncharacterized protein LOC132189096 [Corylus avellana]XP_059459599.1 uncharacterized protein LOC132189096 [Corylus avellana]
MYNGIGLQTPRGSGTNGYIQGNKFFIRHKTGRIAENTKGFETNQGTAGVTRKPNKDILEHDRKRQIELKLVVLQDTLMDQGYTDAEIAEKVDEARKTLEAAASDDGPGAIVAGDNKLSETQTHQIAARKEKQMETLRAAFGIASSEPNEQNIEGTDDARDGRKNGPSDDIKQYEKREHSFLDREFRSKKNMEEDQKAEKDDKKKGVVKESRRHKKESKKRRHETDSSDTDSGRDHGKALHKKHRRGNRGSDGESDSDIDVYKKRKPSKNYKKSRMHDSDDSDSATDSDGNVNARKISKKHKKSRANDSDDSDSATDSDIDVEKKRKASKKFKKNRKNDSDASDSATDDDIGNESSKKGAQYKKSSRRHDSAGDSRFDEGPSKQQIQNGNQPARTSRRHDSEDESDDTDSEVEKKRGQLEKQRNPHSGSRQKERGDADVEDHRKSNNGRHLKSTIIYDVDGEYDSDRGRKYKREITDKIRRSGRHDSEEDDDFGNDTNDKAEKHRIKRNNTDKMDSDVRYESNAKMTAGRQKPVEKEVFPIDDIDNSRYKSKRDTVDGYSYQSQDVIRKRNLNDGNEDAQPESKSRGHNYVKEEEHSGEQQKDSKIESESYSRTYISKDDQKREDYRRFRSGGRHDNETVERGGRILDKDDGPERLSRKDDQDYEELGGGRRHNRYGEEPRGRKHRRDEDYEYRKHERVNEEQQHGSRRQVRGEEEEHDNGRHERDRHMDYSKKVRYDDSRSSERRRYDDRYDDDRAKRHDDKRDDDRARRYDDKRDDGRARR